MPRLPRNAHYRALHTYPPYSGPIYVFAESIKHNVKSSSDQDSDRQSFPTRLQYGHLLMPRANNCVYKSFLDLVEEVGREYGQKPKFVSYAQHGLILSMTRGTHKIVCYSSLTFSPSTIINPPLSRRNGISFPILSVIDNNLSAIFCVNKLTR